MKKHLRNLIKKPLFIAGIALAAVSTASGQSTITSQVTDAIADNTTAATTMAGGVIPFVALLALVGIAIWFLRKK